jgi:peptide deformylase
MRIIVYPNPILHSKNEPIGEIHEDVRNKIRRMFEILYRERGVGLAAPQVGWNVRLFITNIDGSCRKEFEKVYINPEIVEFFGEHVWMPEGCLSLPDVWGKIKRWSGVRVRARNEAGETFEEKLEGLSAQAAQHEMDHLDGMLFYEKMSPADRLQNRPFVRELEKINHPAPKRGVVGREESSIS